MLGIVPGEVGATYLSKGMLFVTLSFEKDAVGEDVAKCLVLDDNPKFLKRIPPGTVMDVEAFSSVWREAMRIASLPEQGKVPT